MPQCELIVNYAKCTGCRLCESACSIGHTGETNPIRSRIRIAQLKEEADSLSIPVKCMVCENPPCEAVCAWKKHHRSDLLPQSELFQAFLQRRSRHTQYGRRPFGPTDLATGSFQYMGDIGSLQFIHGRFGLKKPIH